MLLNQPIVAATAAISIKHFAVTPYVQQFEANPPQQVLCASLLRSKSRIRKTLSLPDTHRLTDDLETITLEVCEPSLRQSVNPLTLAGGEGGHDLTRLVLGNHRAR